MMQTLMPASLTQRQEQEKFKASQGNLVRLGLKIENERRVPLA